MAPTRDRTLPGTETGPGGLLQLLRDGRARTRADLVAETGQSRSTIATRVDALLATGLVASVGSRASTGGRPPTAFAFDPTSRVVLGVDLGAAHGRLAVTDLAGSILAEHAEPVRISDAPEKVLGWVARTGHELLDRAGRPSTDLAGLGLGLPGPVEHSTGRPVDPPIMPGWHGVDVPGILGAHFAAPILVDNDVNLMALGEHAMGFPDVDDLLFVKVATGIGAGIIADGELRRGAQGAAGDLGHMAVPGGEPRLCTCGNTGCVEALASGNAIATKLREAGIDATTSDDVVALVRAGDPTATATLRQAGRELGAVLAGTVSLLNPSVVVIGGSLSAAGEQLLAGIREVVYARSLPLATQHLQIVGTRTARQAAVLGASVLASDFALSTARIDALTAP